MHKYLSLAIFVLSMPLALLAADDAVEQEGKIYVQPRAVRIMKKDIFLHTKDGRFKTHRVCRDRQGIYVLEKDLVKAPSPAKKKTGGRVVKNQPR